MNEPVLSCRGFTLAGIFVPAFEVDGGALVTLQVPSRIESVARLADILAGKVQRPEVELHGHAAVAERADLPIGWRRWLWNPAPGKWLMRQGFTSDEAAAVLTRHGIDDRFQLSQYAAGPRAVLGLETALRSNPDVVVFNTSGLDPRWELAVQELVRSRLHRTAAVYLATPYMSNGETHRRSMPGETVVELLPQSPAPV